jgi:hypothetical protein
MAKTSKWFIFTLRRYRAVYGGPGHGYHQRGLADD